MIKKPQNRKPPIRWAVTVLLSTGATAVREYVAHTAHAAKGRANIPLDVEQAIAATPVIPRTQPTPLSV